MRGRRRRLSTRLVSSSGEVKVRRREEEERGMDVATSAKLANLLSSPFDNGKNIGDILKMATEGVPLGKMTKI